MPKSDRPLGQARDRTVPLDAAVAARRRQVAEPIAPLNAQMEAMATSKDAVLVTRNTFDFLGEGVQPADPWIVQMPSLSHDVHPPDSCIRDMIPTSVIGAQTQTSSPSSPSMSIARCTIAPRPHLAI